MRSIKNIIFGLLLTVALAVFLVFWDSNPEIFMASAPEPVKVVSAADSYMLKTKAKVFNDEGRLAFLLEVDEGEYFQGQGEFFMRSPRIQAYSQRKGEAPWHLTAEEGVVLGRQQVELRGNVHVWQLLGGQASVAKREITTPRLSFYPESDEVNTDQTIVFKSPGHTASGTGFSANLAEQTYQLHSGVKGRHHGHY